MSAWVTPSPFNVQQLFYEPIRQSSSISCFCRRQSDSPIKGKRQARKKSEKHWQRRRKGNSSRIDSDPWSHLYLETCPMVPTAISRRRKSSNRQAHTKKIHEWKDAFVDCRFALANLGSGGYNFFHRDIKLHEPRRTHFQNEHLARLIVTAQLFLDRIPSHRPANFHGDVVQVANRSRAMPDLHGCHWLGTINHTIKEVFMVPCTALLPSLILNSSGLCSSKPISFPSRLKVQSISLQVTGPK